MEWDGGSSCQHVAPPQRAHGRGPVPAGTELKLNAFHGCCRMARWNEKPRRSVFTAGPVQLRTGQRSNAFCASCRAGRRHEEAPPEQGGGAL